MAFDFKKEYKEFYMPKKLRVDDDLKTKSDELFENLGTDTTTANPYEVLTGHQIMDKLEKTREHATQGLYKEATEVSREMRAKYGLEENV